MPSKQTIFPNSFELRVRGVTCRDPKLNTIDLFYLKQTFLQNQQKTHALSSQNLGLCFECTS